MRYHFIGICGAGMSAVAKLLLDLGHTVTGSDEGCYPPISDYLIANSIPCLTPHKKENIPADVDFIVIGKHATLTKEKNEEVAYAFSLDKPILSFPQVLEKITANKKRVVICGSFGKSTCTSLMSWCLEYNKKDPSYFIGALPITPSTNARIGKGEDFILEGDEYPAANWDITSKFLYYHPKDILLTALAHDHVNIFKTHADYIEPFTKLIQNIPTDGNLFVSLDDETIKEQLTTLPHTATTYGLNKEALWHADEIQYGDTTTFSLIHNSTNLGTLTTSLLGKHNIQNIVGISALLISTKRLTFDEVALSVASFRGIVRRLDRKSYKTSIPVYEGFGSSFDKARSAIEAIQLHFPTHPLTIIFEPHTFSWRNKAVVEWYDTVFKEAQNVFIYKPPTHGEDTHSQLTHEEIINRVASSGSQVMKFTSKEEGVSALMSTISPSSIILILSSGGMDGLLPELITQLETTYPRNHI
jgi:UDP-N-acetylmuramate: L-alanyl-gamma-D-glutamyl-meso-diaminopimelate ligase